MAEPVKPSSPEAEFQDMLAYAKGLERHQDSAETVEVSYLVKRFGDFACWLTSSIGEGTACITSPSSSKVS